MLVGHHVHVQSASPQPQHHSIQRNLDTGRKKRDANNNGTQKEERE